MNINEVQQIAAKKLGFSFTVPSELSAANRELLYDEEARFIQANPGLFNDNQKDWAKKRLGGAWFGVPLEGYSIGDAVQDFSSEFANQAIKINDSLNPFSENNRRIIFWFAVIGGAAYFLAPVIIQAIAASKNAKAVPTK